MGELVALDVLEQTQHDLVQRAVAKIQLQLLATLLRLELRDGGLKPTLEGQWQPRHALPKPATKVSKKHVSREAETLRAIVPPPAHLRTALRLVHPLRFGATWKRVGAARASFGKDHRVAIAFILEWRDRLTLRPETSMLDQRAVREAQPPLLHAAIDEQCQ
jgi:hypothetical protein